VELPIDQLVPGDIVKLSAGDMIPADLRIIQARDLFVAQASLTGESLPVEKVARSRDPLQATRWSATPCALWAPTW
jgi:Mg2+-importing ATPase